MKFVAVVLIAVVSLAGCGGNPKPAAATLAHFDGRWTGHLTSTPTVDDPVIHVTDVTLRLSQGAPAGGEEPTAPLTAALTAFSPDCPAVVSGTGEGQVVGSSMTVTLSLSDHGSIKIFAGDAASASPEHLFNGQYTFTAGTCAPQFGTLTATKH